MDLCLYPGDGDDNPQFAGESRELDGDPQASVHGLRPIDLLGSPVGIDIVENLLKRNGQGRSA